MPYYNSFNGINRFIQQVTYRKCTNFVGKIPKMSVFYNRYHRMVT